MPCLVAVWNLCRLSEERDPSGHYVAAGRCAPIGVTENQKELDAYADKVVEELKPHLMKGETAKYWIRLYDDRGHYKIIGGGEVSCE